MNLCIFFDSEAEALAGIWILSDLLASASFVRFRIVCVVNCEDCAYI